MGGGVCWRVEGVTALGVLTLRALAYRNGTREETWNLADLAILLASRLLLLRLLSACRITLLDTVRQDIWCQDSVAPYHHGILRSQSTRTVLHPCLSWQML